MLTELNSSMNYITVINKKEVIKNTKHYEMLFLLL